MKWQQLTSAALGPTSNVIQIDEADVQLIKSKVGTTPFQRMRICAHDGADSNLHEMIIVFEQGGYMRPHRHMGKSESFHVISGCLDVVIFDDLGNIDTIISMGDYQSGKTFYYRLAKPAYHTLLLRSEFVVLHETTNGPFDKTTEQFAPWAPLTEHVEAVKNYLEELEIKIKNHLMEQV